MAIQQDPSVLLASQVKDWTSASKPSGFTVPVGNYLADFSGLDYRTDDKQLINGQPSVVAELVFVATDPLPGKQLRQMYNFSRTDKNGDNWLIAQFLDVVMVLSAYNAELKFNRYQNWGPKELAALIARVSAAKLENVSITAPPPGVSRSGNPVQNLRYNLPGVVGVGAPSPLDNDGAAGAVDADKPPQEQSKAAPKTSDVRFPEVGSKVTYDGNPNFVVLNVDETVKTVDIKDPSDPTNLACVLVTDVEF